MTDLFDVFETNEDLENDGVELDLKRAGAKVTIARNGGSNTEWIKTYSEEYSKLGKAGFKGLDLIEQRNFERKLFCKAVIKKHKVKNEEGKYVDGVLIKENNEKKIVPFTVENMMKCFDQLPEYYLMIKEYADDYKTFLTIQLEEQEKN